VTVVEQFAQSVPDRRVTAVAKTTPQPTWARSQGSRPSPGPNTFSVASSRR
jgi:hypothetical protein